MKLTNCPGNGKVKLIKGPFTYYVIKKGGGGGFFQMITVDHEGGGVTEMI